eukprot:451571_1
MKQILINDAEYETYPHIKSGYDIAILTINNKKAADYYRNKCEKIFLVNNFDLLLDDRRQMILFGFPGDKNAGERLWGMSTPPHQNEFTCGFNAINEQIYLVNNQIDTQSGQSGASIYCHGDKKDTFWILSVHTGGSVKAGQNYGTLLDSHILKWIKNYFNSINIEIDHKIISKK